MARRRNWRRNALLPLARLASNSDPTTSSLHPTHPRNTVPVAAMRVLSASRTFRGVFVVFAFDRLELVGLAFIALETDGH